MNTNKSTKIIFWVTTIIIFLFEGVMPALTGHTELAKEGIRHLGYPDYFRVMLGIYKMIGSLVIVLPFITGRIKEWAYFGLGITMISAFISHVAVGGFSGMAFFPLVIFAILVASYLSYHKLQTRSQVSLAH